MIGGSWRCGEPGDANGTRGPVPVVSIRSTEDCR